MANVTPAAEPDLVAGLRFDHALAMQTKLRVVELSASFNTLLAVLAPEGTVARRAFEQMRPQALAQEQQQAAREVIVALDGTPDKYALGDLPQIDCAKLIPLCQARCCTLLFPLSGQDLDEGIIRWDYGHPYQIRRGKDGYCVHNDGPTRSCQVHGQRPAVCRQYDCRDDKRIWTDFANRVPAPLPQRTAPLPAATPPGPGDATGLAETR